MQRLFGTLGGPNFLHRARPLGRMRISGKVNAARIGPQVDQLLRHVRSVHDKVNHSGCNRGFGHAVVFRVFRALRQGDAALLFDPGKPCSAVAAGARHHDGNGSFFMHLGQSTKKQINRHMPSTDPGRLGQLKVPIVHRQVVAGRYDIHMVGLNGRDGVHLDHRHGRCPLKNFSRTAFMVGREVKDDHKSHAVAHRHTLKKSDQRTQSPRRCADADNRKVDRVQRQIVKFFRIKGSFRRLGHSECSL